MPLTNPTYPPSTFDFLFGHALADLETITEEIELKIHLASMDAKTMWHEKLEPKLHEARAHACDAKTASKFAIDEAVRAFKKFATSL